MGQQKKRKPLRQYKTQVRQTDDTAADGEIKSASEKQKISDDGQVHVKSAPDDEHRHHHQQQRHGVKRAKVEDGQHDDNEDVDGDDDEDHDDDDDAEDDDADEDGDIKLEGNIEHVTQQYTFEFNDMREDYSEGITMLLKKMIQNPTKAYEIGTCITTQALVGTVIACEGGSDAFAFATVLPITKQQQRGPEDPVCVMLGELSTAVGKLKSATASSSSSSSSSSSTSSSSAATSPHDSFLECVTGARVCTTGVMIHRRFPNLPLELIGPLHSNLEQDLGWAQQKHEADDGGESEAEREHFRTLQSVLLLAPCTMDDAGATSKKGQAKGSWATRAPGAGQAAVDVLGSAGVLFDCFEDEIFCQSASHAYLFRSRLSPSPLVAALLPIGSLKKCVNSICALAPPLATSDPCTD